MNFLANLAALAQDGGAQEYQADVDFLTQAPVFVAAAENRILRDLDLLSTVVPDDTGVLTNNHRRFYLPTTVGTFIVLSEVQLVINDIAQPSLDWISREAMNVVYPSARAVGDPSIPRYVAPFDQQSVLIGPAPDQNYKVHCTGTQYPKSLMTGVSLTLNTSPPQISITSGSPGDQGTYISNNLPDLFLAAQMISVSAWMRNFGAMSDDPKMAINWTQEYERLKASEEIVEARKRLAAQGWSPRQPAKVATPPQT